VFQAEVRVSGWEICGSTVVRSMAATEATGTIFMAT
jgi:hypothetical protein